MITALHPFVLRNRISPAVSVNKDVTVISDHSPPTWAGEPKGTQEGEEYLPSSSHQTTATPYGESWGRKLRKRKHRKLAPYSRGAYQRNDFSEPRLLHLLIFRKAFNSLMWDIWFSLIYKKSFWHLYYLSLLQNLLTTWLLPLLPWISSLWVTWDAWSPKNSHF